MTGIGDIFFRAMPAQLRAAEAEVDRIGEHELGRFGWATDPDGNRFELWEHRRPEAALWL